MEEKKGLFTKGLFSKPLIVLEYYSIAMLAIYSIFVLILMNDLENPMSLIGANISIVALIFVLARIFEKYADKRATILIRKLYLIPVIFVIYTQVQYFVRILNPELCDPFLVELDCTIFGVNPTEWISAISFPALTEYMQYAYFSFFFLPIIHGIEWYARKRDFEFNEVIRIVVFSFYFSYLLYFFVPAIGPRFFIHDFHLISSELPGLWLTDTLREIINTGGGIPIGCPNPADMVNRDCMPSGHTMMTLINIILAFRLKSKLRYFFLIVGSSLIFATIYLRYHYVVDVMAGVIFCFIALWMEPYFNRLIKKVFKAEY